MPKSFRSEILALLCQSCGGEFLICRRCYRNHRYCSKPCSVRGHAKTRQKARKKYNMTEIAKIKHRERNRMYRKKINAQSTPTVTDKSIEQGLLSIIQTSNSTISCSAHRCAVCGEVIFQEVFDGKLANKVHEDFGYPVVAKK